MEDLINVARQRTLPVLDLIQFDVSLASTGIDLELTHREHGTVMMTERDGLNLVAQLRALEAKCPRHSGRSARWYAECECGMEFRLDISHLLSKILINRVSSIVPRRDLLAVVEAVSSYMDLPPQPELRALHVEENDDPDYKDGAWAIVHEGPMDWPFLFCEEVFAGRIRVPEGIAVSAGTGSRLIVSREVQEL